MYETKTKKTIWMVEWHLTIQWNFILLKNRKIINKLKKYLTKLSDKSIKRMKWNQHQQHTPNKHFVNNKLNWKITKYINTHTQHTKQTKFNDQSYFLCIWAQRSQSNKLQKFDDRMNSEKWIKSKYCYFLFYFHFIANTLCFRVRPIN